MISLALNLSAAVLIAGTASTTNFSYDALGRVTKVEYSNGSIVEYQYDAAGNRIQKTTTASPNTGAKVIVVPLNGFTVIQIP